MRQAFPWGLPAQDVVDVMQHPSHQDALLVVADLLRDARRARSLVDCDNTQRAVFQFLFHAETHLAAVRRCVKRLEKRRALPADAPQLRSKLPQNELRSWRLEALVFDRICRQLRAVGDALAWRVSGFDRRYVIAVSANDPPGPMAKKEGLDHELGAAVAMRERGHLGLLHDLTSTLRIGDITEFSPDGGKLLWEIKKDARRRDSVQMRRMKVAVDAVMKGGPLPGSPDSQIITPSTVSRTHTGLLRRVMSDAARTGVAGTAIPGGRAIVVVNFPAVARLGIPADEQAQQWSHARARALAAAGLAPSLHTLSMTSFVINQSLPRGTTPFGVFPMDEQRCAELICDYVTFEAICDPQRVADGLVKQGADRAEVTLPFESGPMATDAAVLTVLRGDRQLTVAPSAFWPFLIETLRLEDYVAAMLEVLDGQDVHRHPEPAFVTTRVWR